MGMTRILSTYSDIGRVLDAALKAGGGTFRLPTKGKARRWMQRAYFYRSLLHELQSKRLEHIVDSRPTITPYDTMKLTLDGKEVVIEFSKIEGVLLDKDGNPLKLPDVSTQEPAMVMGKLDEEDLEILKEVSRDLKLETEE